MLEGEEALDAFDDEMDETASYETASYPPGSRLGRARRAGRLARGRHARLRGDVCARRWFWQLVLRARNLTIAFTSCAAGFPLCQGACQSSAA